MNMREKIARAPAELDPADLYQPPSPLADAIQSPLHPADRWQARVLNGYNAERQFRRAMLTAARSEP